MNTRDIVPDWIGAIQPDSGIIPAFISGNQDVFERETRTLFLSTWQFVAHESEVKNAGDYVTRMMGQIPVIVSRGEDGQIRVFINICRHHGMKVCRIESGHGPVFRCPYHGFTYRNTGQLAGVPYERHAYDGLDKSKMSLYEAHVDTYAGMIFACLAASPEPLSDFLGDIKWYLDLIVGRADMEVVGPPQKWEVPSNWKFPAENFMTDAYHTMFSHRSISEIGMAPKDDFARMGYHIHAGRGHGLGLGAPADIFMFAPELREEFAQRLSESQLTVLNQMKNAHGSVFPNLSFLVSLLKLKGKPVSFTTLRLWQPIDAQRTQVWSWLLMERNAPAEWKELSQQAYTLTFGPSGIFEQDDTENWTDISRNVQHSWVSDLGVEFNYEMGVQRKLDNQFEGPGEVYDGKFSEVNGRAFYREWLKSISNTVEVAFK